MLKQIFDKLTRSARHELFNPLTYPFLLATLAYGIGFLFFSTTSEVGKSSLFIAMYAVYPAAPVLWGLCAVITILLGLTFLLYNKPPAGRTSGLLGFMIWVFAAACWLLTGAVLPFFSVAVPNLIFWVWQYLSLSRFHREDVEDAEFEEYRNSLNQDT